MAQQEAQRASMIVEIAKQERQQKIVQAEGEAAAATLISFYRNSLTLGVKRFLCDMTRPVIELGISQ